MTPNNTTTQQQEQEQEQDLPIEPGLEHRTHRLETIIDDSPLLYSIYDNLRSTKVLNQEGLYAVLFELSLTVGKHGRLSQLTSTGKKKMMLHIASTTITVFIVNHKKFGIKTERIPQVISAILRTANLSLSRSLGGKERDYAYIDKQVQELYQRSDHKQTVQGKRFGMFAGGSREREEQYE